MKKYSYVGIDISKKTLDVAICEGANSKFEDSDHIKVTNDKDGFDEIMKWLKTKNVTAKKVIFGMENTGLYGFELRMFLEENNIPYCVYMPLDLKLSMGLVRGKNDKVDAFRIAYYTWLHREELRFSKLAGTTILKLQRLNAERKRYVRECAEHKAFANESKGKKSNSTIERNARMIEVLQAEICAIEEEMQDVIENDEMLKKNYDLLLSIKGIGSVNAISTIIHTDNFRSFENARQYACYIGVAPFEHSSGTSVRGKTRVSSCGAIQLKAELTQAARSAIMHDDELRLYYERKTREGKAFGVVLNAVKFKLICRMFAVIKRGTPYVMRKSFLCD